MGREVGKRLSDDSASSSVRHKLARALLEWRWLRASIRPGIPPGPTGAGG